MSSFTRRPTTLLDDGRPSPHFVREDDEAEVCRHFVIEKPTSRVGYMSLPVNALDSSSARYFVDAVDHGCSNGIVTLTSS